MKEILEEHNIDSGKVEHYLQSNFPIDEIISIKVLKTIFHIKFISKSGLNYEVTLNRKKFEKNK